MRRWRTRARRDCDAQVRVIVLRALTCVCAVWRSARILVPSVAEVEATLSGKPFSFLVAFLDDKTKSIEIDSMSNVRDVIQQITAITKLESSEGYALYEEHNRIGRSMAANERICDILAKWDRCVW
jgi:hypothetical protein